MLWSVVERKGGSMLVAAALLLMAAGSAQALVNCDAPIGALAHGASAALTDSTTAPTLTSGSATATCNNGTLVYSGTSCTPGCAAQTVNWGAGCTATIAASLHTNSGTLTNTAAGYTGTVTATCTNGTLGQSGATCNAHCAARAESWTVSGSTCTGATPAITHGSSSAVSDGTAPTTGSVTMTCTDAVLSQSGESCVTAGPPCQSNWDSDCWYLGNFGQSCDAVCAGVGKTCDATAFGNTNTTPNCSALMTSLGVGGTGGAGRCVNYGCTKWSDGLWRYCGIPTCASSNGIYRRACPCI